METLVAIVAMVGAYYFVTLMVELWQGFWHNIKR